MRTDLSYIAPQLHGLVVPVDTLTIDPDNARLHPDRNLDATRASLKKFGQRIPIVVQEQGMVVRAGNGRVLLARELGWSHIAAVVVDETDAEAAAFALADNRSAELAEWDWAVLADTLAQLKVDVPDFDLHELGWTNDEMDALTLSSAWDSVETPDGDGPVGGLQGGGAETTIVLKFTAEESEEMAELLGDVTTSSVLGALRGVDEG